MCVGGGGEGMRRDYSSSQPFFECMVGVKDIFNNGRALKLGANFPIPYIGSSGRRPDLVSLSSVAAPSDAPPHAANDSHRPPLRT